MSNFDKIWDEVRRMYAYLEQNNFIKNSYVKYEGYKSYNIWFIKNIDTLEVPLYFDENNRENMLYRQDFFLNFSEKKFLVEYKDFNGYGTKHKIFSMHEKLASCIHAKLLESVNTIAQQNVIKYFTKKEVNKVLSGVYEAIHYLK